MKMYEMLNLFPDIVLSSQKSNIKSFHLCEAPGAFISAFNHYITSKGYTHEWYAQTLNPKYNSDALDDHYGLIKNSLKMAFRK